MPRVLEAGSRPAGITIGGPRRRRGAGVLGGGALATRARAAASLATTTEMGSEVRSQAVVIMELHLVRTDKNI